MDYSREPDYERRLPHYTPNDAPYFVTFNLHGSIPADVILKLRNREARFADYDRHLHDGVLGEHYLRDDRIAQVVFDKLCDMKRELLTLTCFTIMSNHVHLLMHLHKDQELSEVMQSIKGGTARECNRLLDRTGTFWQHESYDRVLRRNEHRVTINYILNNPVKARVVSNWRDYKWTWTNPDLFPGKV